MKKGVLFHILILFVATSFVSAEITLSEPKEFYNLGDKFEITADGLIGAETGNLNVNLICLNYTVPLLKIPANSFSSNEELPYSISKTLTTEDLEVEKLTNLLGKCRIEVKMNSQSAVTNEFEISNKIFLTTSFEKEKYNPGEAINLDITAKKASGDLFDGFIKVKGATSFEKEIEKGNLREIFSMPETTEAGFYTVNVSAYDSKNLNRGEVGSFFEINQVASSIITSLSEEEISPGNSVKIGAELFDQSGKEMEGVISIKIISPKPESKESELTIQVGEFTDFSLGLNATAGMWQVITSHANLFEEREFELLGVQKADFEFNGSVLIIKSTGNIPYNKIINVKIGNETEQLMLNIGVGETRKFNLKAPKGEYQVVVDDGENSISQNVLLTGRTISIRDLRTENTFPNNSLIWIFLIIILGVASIILFRRYRKTRNLGGSSFKDKLISFKLGAGNLDSDFREQVPSNTERIKDAKSRLEEKLPSSVKSGISNSINFTNKSPRIQGLAHGEYSHEDKSMVDLTKSKFSGAESSLVLKGEKHPSAVISVSIKNYSTLKSHAKESLTKIIESAKEKKGLIDWKENYIYIVFSPVVTRTYNNEMLASKVGFTILKSLLEYNRKFSDRINFNIGAHSGELVVSKSDGKLKYTSLGNTISLAKRISDSDNSKFLVSGDIRKKMMRDLKTIKEKDIGKNSIYSILEMKDKEVNEAKLKDLLKRMDE